MLDDAGDQVEGQGSVVRELDRALAALVGGQFIFERLDARRVEPDVILEAGEVDQVAVALERGDAVADRLDRARSRLGDGLANLLETFFTAGGKAAM